MFVMAHVKQCFVHFLWIWTWPSLTHSKKLVVILTCVTRRLLPSEPSPWEHSWQTVSSSSQGSTWQWGSTLSSLSAVTGGQRDIWTVRENIFSLSKSHGRLPFFFSFFKFSISYGEKNMKLKILSSRANLTKDRFRRISQFVDERKPVRKSELFSM